MAHRVINFAPGPATLPLSTLEQAREDLVDFQGTGMSILEHSHRGKDYAAVHAETKQLLTDLLRIPEGYRILFMQGGARGQFGLLPMNLLPKIGSADYVMTGTWSETAIEEARIVGTAREAGSTRNADGTYTRVPRPEELELDPGAAYVHVTSNNTIFGTQFFDFPDTGSVPLVADMSSDVAWAPLDVSRFGLIYAGAQKNLGIPGITVVVIREDLIERGRTDLPRIFQYRTLAKADSLQNTITTFAVYMMRNVLRWVREQGGLEAMERRNRSKAERLYGAVDASPDFYRCPVEPASRSVMNAVFRLPSEELEAKFVAEAKEHGMVGLKGHRSVGGIRVSMYNAMEPSGVETLVSFMGDFAARNG